MSLPVERADLAPWEPEGKWSPQKTEAFICYRDLGHERSLAKVVEAGGTSAGNLRQLEEWSRVDGWVARCAAYDAERDRIRRAEHAKELERVSRKHARSLEAAITVLARPAIRLAELIDSGELVDDDDPHALAAAVERAGKTLPSLIQASRLVHGLSTENVQGRHEHRVAVEGATVEDLDRYLEGYDDGAVLEADVVAELPPGEQSSEDR